MVLTTSTATVTTAPTGAPTPPVPGRRRSPDGITAHYVAASAQADHLLARVVEQVRLPPAYGRAYHDLQLGRPLFAEHAEITRFGADLRALFKLLASLPDRCFDGSLARYGQALGMDPRLADLMRLGASGPIELYGRADAYHDGQSFKLLEFNIGSELGGIDAAQLNRAFLAVPGFGDFATRTRLGYVDTVAVLAGALYRAASAVNPGGEPTVALLEGPGGLADHEAVFESIQEAMRGYGINLLLGEVQQVRARHGKLLLDDVPLDVVLRYFTATQLVDEPSGRDLMELMVRAHAERRTVLFTPLEYGLLESKANLALVHDPRIRTAFTDEEIRLVDTVVPWTRQIGSRTGAAPADRAQLLDRCRAGRDSLILKPGTGWGGVGAVLGSRLNDREWSTTLQSIQDEDYVVQEVVQPAPEPVFNPATGRIEAWQANWGVFATDDGYAGAFVRALRPRDGAVISYSNPGTRGTCVFTYPDERRVEPRTQCPRG